MQFGVRAACTLMIGLWFSAAATAQNQDWSQQEGSGQRRITNDPAEIQAALASSSHAVEAPRTPPGFPLDPESQKWVDDLLNYWERTSSEVRTYQCDFQRWHYSPLLTSYRDPETNKLAARMVTRGKIRFAHPDRGRYDVDEVWHFIPPEQPGGQPTYELTEEPEVRNKERERWICDGTAIYEFDFVNRRLNELRLPPELQGEGLKNSPLPFVFGAKAVDLKERFWIRPMMPEGIPAGHYMIEAIPKTAQDARAYSKVQVVLSQQPFLPVRVEIFAVNYDPKTNPESMALVFENRKINDPLQRVSSWMTQFFSRPMTPPGWERFEGTLGQEPPQ